LKIYSCCISRDRKRAPNKPYFFSAANNLNFGEVSSYLSNLIIVKEMLIARIYIYIKYKYCSYIVYFLYNVSKLFKERLALPKELDIILLQPPNIEGNSYF
ncbi:hypothetical protein EDB80DRAFT_591515, partial [Ilyonectria destructans]